MCKATSPIRTIYFYLPRVWVSIKEYALLIVCLISVPIWVDSGAVKQVFPEFTTKPGFLAEVCSLERVTFEGTTRLWAAPRSFILPAPRARALSLAHPRA